MPQGLTAQLFAAGLMQCAEGFQYRWNTGEHANTCHHRAKQSEYDQWNNPAVGTSHLLPAFFVADDANVIQQHRQ